MSYTITTSTGIDLTSDIDALNSRLTTDESAIATNSTNIGINTSAISALNTRLTTDEATIAALNAARIRLTAPLTLYVATSGSDTTGTGTSRNPFATPQAAWSYAFAELDLAGYVLTISLANGTYTNFVASGLLVGQGANYVYIVGNTATPTSVVISATLANAIVLIGAQVSITGMQLQATGTSTTTNNMGSGLGVWNYSNCVIGQIYFGACSNSHMQATSSSIILSQFGNSYNIAGGAVAHMTATGNSIIALNTCTITVATGLVITYFVEATNCSNVSVLNSTYHLSGTAPTGTRYIVNTFSNIVTNGAGATFFPGTIAGSTSNGTYI